MAKKPIPIPVADEPGYPPFSEVKQRAEDEVARHASGVSTIYAACPNCGEQLISMNYELRPTAFEPNRPVGCPKCGFRSTLPTEGCY